MIEDSNIPIAIIMVSLLITLEAACWRIGTGCYSDSDWLGSVAESFKDQVHTRTALRINTFSQV